MILQKFRTIFLVLLFAFSFLGQAESESPVLKKLKEISAEVQKLLNANNSKGAIKAANKLVASKLKYENLPKGKEKELSQEQHEYLNVLWWRAISYQNLKEYKNAIQDYEFIFKNDLNLGANIFSYYSQCLRAIGEKEKAYHVLETGVKKIQEEIRTGSDSAILQAQMGWDYYEDKKLDLAIENTKKAIQDDSKKSWIQFNLSFFYFKTNKKEEAMHQFFEAWNVSFSEFENPELIGTITDWEDLENNNPSMEVYTTLWFLYKTKENSKKKEIFSKIKQIDLTKYLQFYFNPKIQYNLGAYYSLTNNWEKTNELLKNIYEVDADFLLKAKKDEDYSFYFQDKKNTKQGLEAKIEEEKIRPKLVIQNGHTRAVNGILVSKNEKKMISYASDNTIKIWDLKERKLLTSLEGHTGSVSGVQLSKDETKLFSYSWDTTIKIWDMKKGKLLKSLEGHTSAVTGIQLSKDETKLFSYSNPPYGKDKTIKIWDVKEGKLLTSLEGHTDSVTGIQLSQDESNLFSYSSDNTIKIWDLKEGKLLTSLEGHTTSVWGIQLSKDKNKLFSYSYDNTIKIWDLKEGKLFKSLEGHTGSIRGIQLSEDKSKLFSYSYDKTIKIWDLKNEKLLTSLTGHSDTVTGIQLSKDESKLFSYSDVYEGKDNTINIWDMKEGKLIKSLEGHTNRVRGMHLSKDETKLFSYSWDTTIKIWDVKEGKLLKSLEGHTSAVTGIQLSQDESNLFSYSSDNTIKIWNMKEGKLLASLVGHTSSVFWGMQFSKDESKLFSYSSDNTIKIWDMKKGKLLKSLEGHTDSVWGIQLSKDETKLFSYSYDKTIKIWDVKEGRLLKSLEGHTKGVWGIQLSKDETKLFSYSEDWTIKIWDVKEGKLLTSLVGSANGIQLSKDESKLFFGSEYNIIKIWDVKEGKILTSLKGHTMPFLRVQLNKEEKKVFSYSKYNPDISYSDDYTIKIWDVKEGRLLKSLEGHSGSISEIQLSKDESKLFSYSQDKTIKIWDVKEGKLLTSLEGHIMGVNGIQLSKDESKLFSYSYDKTIKIWDVNEGKLLKSLEGHIDRVIGIYLIEDESKLISNSIDNNIKIWDVKSGKLLQTLDHKSSSIVKYIFNEDVDPNVLTSFSVDGSIRYWNISTGKLLITQLLFKNGHSIYYTPDGYFDFTDKSVLEFISFVSPKIQNNFVDLQDLMNDYNVDGLLELVTNNKFKPNKKNNLTKGIETTSLVKALFDTQESAPSGEDNKTLSFQITERGSKFEKAVVYVNGIQVDEKTLVEGENVEDVKLEDDSKEGYFKYRVKFVVPLNYGTNRVEVKAYNEYHIPQSFPAFEIQRKIPDNKELAKPDLYILSVGVNDYKTKKLTYSVPDAKAMAEAFQQGKSGIYREVHTRLLVDAKKKEIEDAFLEIEKKARPQDIVLVYFSGHGMNAFTREGKKLFYFVPQDFNWPDDPENQNVARMQGIDADYLNETFTKIKSHKLILILDSCHSGSVNVALASRGQDKEKATRKAMEKMANGTGRFIFASSSGNEESREHKDVGHGLYTYVLLNALGKNKDKNITDADSINKDGFIYLSEIRSYIEQQFEEQTAKYLKGVIQTPPSMSLGRNGMHERVNDFPLVKSK